VFYGEGFSGSAGSAHHFIGDEKDVVAIADLADHGKVFRRRHRRPGRGAYDGFADEGRDVLRTLSLDGSLQFAGTKDIAFRVGFLEGAVVAVARRD
jgi:hypothetical protein